MVDQPVGAAWLSTVTARGQPRVPQSQERLRLRYSYTNEANLAFMSVFASFQSDRAHCARVYALATGRTSNMHQPEHPSYRNRHIHRQGYEKIMQRHGQVMISVS